MAEENFKYEEIGKNYRFFLTWRYGIFAGYLVVLWSSFSMAFNLLEKKVDSVLVGFLLITSSIIILCLWIAEQRNRDLYRGLINKGKELENSENEAYSILSNLSKVKKQWRIKTQSVSLDILAYMCFIVFVSGGIILFNKPNYSNFSITDISRSSWTAIIIIDIIFFVILDPFGLKFIYINRNEKKSKKKPE